MGRGRIGRITTDHQCEDRDPRLVGNGGERDRSVSGTSREPKAEEENLWMCLPTDRWGPGIPRIVPWREIDSAQLVPPSGRQAYSRRHGMS